MATMKSKIKVEQGSALLLVAGILAVMGVVAIFLFWRSEAEWAAVRNLENYDQLQQIAEEQLQERLALYATDDTPTDFRDDAWYGGNGIIEYEQDGCPIRIQIEDEGSKPNLNLLNEDALKELLPNDLSPDPLLDWMDSDDLERASGAETAYYQGLNPAYKAGNGFFASVNEIKQLRNGDKLYPALAPEVTVWGKINPNLLDQYSFLNLLKASHYQSSLNPETIAESFWGFHVQNRFENLDALKQVAALSDPNQLKPYFQIQGSCNPNFVTLAGLKAVLKSAGLDPSHADAIINQRDKQPFDNMESLKGMIAFPKDIKNRTLDDYFTLTTTIVRFKIWVRKRSARYYLETVYERVPKGIEKGWKVYPLEWRVLLNKEAPEYPEAPAASGESSAPGEISPSP